MRAVVIGGTGHIGTYLTPRLVEAGHEVVCITRRTRGPYRTHPAWQAVRSITADRAAEDLTGLFAQRVADLKPDAVIDLVCYTPESNRQLVDALTGRIQHFLHCGTIWVHGHTEVAPTPETQPRRPFCDYGKQKAAIEADLLEATRRDGFPATVLHPGHIVGTGWPPINPQGHLGTWVFEKLAHGEQLTLPNFGLETIHHVHADDVALAFVLALEHWSAAAGESFHVVSPAAVTLRGYAEAAAGWFGREADLRFLPWDEWRTTVTEQEAAITLDHIAHSPNCSIQKAQRLLEYRPRYSSLEATRESVEWLQEQAVISV
jgi:nucleoside-diphosphate-sugar epimerase